MLITYEAADTLLHSGDHSSSFCRFSVWNITPNYPWDVVQMFDKVNMTITCTTETRERPAEQPGQAAWRQAGMPAGSSLLSWCWAVPLGPPDTRRNPCAGRRRCRGSSRGYIHRLAAAHPPVCELTVQAKYAPTIGKRGRSLTDSNNQPLLRASEDNLEQQQRKP